MVTRLRGSSVRAVGELKRKGMLASLSLTLEKCLTQCHNGLMTQVPLTGGEAEAQRGTMGLVSDTVDHRSWS